MVREIESVMKTVKDNKLTFFIFNKLSYFILTQFVYLFTHSLQSIYYFIENA